MTPDELKNISRPILVEWGPTGATGHIKPCLGFWVVTWENGNCTNVCPNDPIPWLSHLRIIRPKAEPTAVAITFTASIPAGYEATGEFRQPDPTVDTYVHQDGVTVIHPAPRGNGMPKGPRIILRKNQTAKERLQVLGENIAAHSMTPMHRISSEIAEILNLMN